MRGYVSKSSRLRGKRVSCPLPSPFIFPLAFLPRALTPPHNCRIFRIYRSQAANAGKQQQQQAAQQQVCVAPRTRSQTRAAGMSMSQLLESRSEQACAVPPRSRRSSRSVASAPPPSPLPDIDGADRCGPACKGYTIVKRQIYYTP